MPFDADFDVDFSPLERGYKKLSQVQDRTLKDIITFNMKMIVRKLAWLTTKAKRVDVPKKKRGRIGRARAGWHASWIGLGMQGKAYSTAGAVKMYAKEGEYKEVFSGDDNYVEIANNVSYLKKIVSSEEMQSVVDKQSKKMINYADKKLNNEIGKLF